ncbi:MAG: efflux RND transporter periplasmic adaptor subunit [Planctomycetia bacterium]|nr:efflux RND transporter periplasmic adaptor subunit [Planctomycetia bacterium]
MSDRTAGVRGIRRILFEMIFFSVIFLIMGVFEGCDFQKKSNSVPNPDSLVPEVEVYTVKPEAVPLISEQPGRTAAFNIAEVRPQVNGIVLKRKFAEGTFVNEGDELYEIDSSVYQANYEKVNANLHNLEKTMERAKELQETRAMSVQEYEDALYGWQRAKADLELARLDLVYCKVKAPLSGKIGFSNITVGALVTNGQPQALAVIEQIDPIYVDLNPSIPLLLGKDSKSGKDPKKASGDQKSLPFWQNAKVNLVLENGSKYKHSGTIKVLDNHVNEDTGTITLRAEFPNPEGTLLPGMFVRAFVEEGIRPDGCLIPQQAVCRNMKGEPYVWIIDKENKAEMRMIRTERSIGNFLLIGDGVAAGDRIVVEGLQYVVKGKSVEPLPAKNIVRKNSFE